VVACLLLGACGVPTGDVRAIDPATVPYGLLSGRAPESSDGAGLRPGEQRARIALVTAQGTLRLVDRAVPAGAPVGTAQALLDELGRGPTEAERRAGLESAVPAAAGLTVREADGVYVVDVAGAVTDQAVDRLPLTVAQVVYTVTAAPGVDLVRLERDGRPVDAPLPDGALTSGPLTRADYRDLLLTAPGTS
jgi:hypothetical protein